MKTQHLPWVIFAGYVTALVFGLAGIGIALNRPELWSHLDLGRQTYAFGMRWGGVLYIVLGALALLIWSFQALGRRRTLQFFLASVSISLAAELIGTSTGWPFGNYAYTSGLGPKVLDRVPFTIPLSWFTVGLASWILATRFSARWLRTTAPWITIPLGVWLLVVWDLVLDPAMAHEAMQARFWVWHETGAYFGMPVINFFGWALTGFAFLTISRLFWKADPPFTVSPNFPLAIYTSNMVFASVLCTLVGLWIPIVIATLFGFVPALLSTFSHSNNRLSSSPRGVRSRPHNRQIENFAWRTLRFLARLTLVGRRYKSQGFELIPSQGPVILAPQHIHHLDDGRVLLALVPRPIRFLVALDWVPSQRWRQAMETLCQLAGWPVIVRPNEFSRPSLVYGYPEAQGVLVRGLREAYSRLCQGQALVVFPEGYPLIDPHLPGRRQNSQSLYEGAVWLAQRTAHMLRMAVPIVPIRIVYSPDRSILVQAGAPIAVTAEHERSVILQRLSLILCEAPEPHIVRFHPATEGKSE